MADVVPASPWRPTWRKPKATPAAPSPPNTLKAYRSDWAAFERFCRGREAASLPAAPATVAAYAAEAARSLKANTVERRLIAISQAHQLAGYPNPVEDKLVRTVMAGIRRVKGAAQQGKEPLSAELLRQMFSGLPDNLRDPPGLGAVSGDN